VDSIAEKLDSKLSTWKPEISREVRAVIVDVIDAADNDARDLLRSRAVEQEVLDQLDEPHPGEVWLAGLGLSAKTRPRAKSHRSGPRCRPVQMRALVNPNQVQAADTEAEYL
jgi:hypothetical protein